eukprot:scpid6833/ scgid5676/ Hemicentin-2
MPGELDSTVRMTWMSAELNHVGSILSAKTKSCPCLVTLAPPGASVGLDWRLEIALISMSVLKKRNHFKQYCIADSTTCSNVLGSYLCPCKTGFTGAGNQSCTDINECASSGMNDCDDPNALCTNTRGSYMCSCKRGFNGTGRTAENGCFDINACSNNVHNCIAVSTCSDLDNGKHTCTCPDKQLQTRDGTCDVEPTFSKTLTSHAVTVGDTATFVCGFIGLIRGGATWLDNKDVVIKHSELYKLTTKSSADDDAAD